MSDSSPFNPLPRGEIFHSPAAMIVWAAVLALPAAAQFELLTQLQLRLASADTKADAHDLRVAGAQTALREVAALLGHSPSVDEYRTARKRHPERNWPADSSIRRILGGSWNVALRSTHLQTVAGGDMVIASLGPLFQASELIAAVRQCTEAIGGVPSLHRYLGWAKRPDRARSAGATSDISTAVRTRLRLVVEGTGRGRARRWIEPGGDRLGHARSAACRSSH